MGKKKSKKDLAVEEIRETLEQEYLPQHPGARIDVYRYNFASIRVRVIDSAFAGHRMTARDHLVWPCLDKLPDDVVGQINLLLLLTPEEANTSLMNVEFEDPTPSRL
jgi:hypothetical protein